MKPCSFCLTPGIALVLDNERAGICRLCLAERNLLARHAARPSIRRVTPPGDAEQMRALHEWIVETKKRDAQRRVDHVNRVKAPPGPGRRQVCAFCGATEESRRRNLYPGLTGVSICDQCTRDPRDTIDDVIPPGSCSFCLTLQPGYAIERTDVRICPSCIQVSVGIISDNLGEGWAARDYSPEQAAAILATRERVLGVDPKYSCSFCGAHRTERMKLVSAMTENVHICDRCVATATRGS